MKIKITFFALFLASCMLTACSGGSKMGGTGKNCGCAAKKGMVGY
jgi:hypothetical protein